MASRLEKVTTLIFCLQHLPLDPKEMNLLRTIIHHYSMETEAEWGAASMDRKDEVAALFDKCKELLNVQPATV